MISPDTDQLDIRGNHASGSKGLVLASGLSSATEVVVFDDPEHWVEDEDYVTAERPCISWAVGHGSTLGTHDI